MTVLTVKGQKWDIDKVEENTVHLSNGNKIDVNDRTLKSINDRLVMRVKKAFKK